MIWNFNNVWVFKKWYFCILLVLLFIEIHFYLSYKIIRIWLHCWFKVFQNNLVENPSIFLWIHSLCRIQSSSNCIYWTWTWILWRGNFCNSCFNVGWEGSASWNVINISIIMIRSSRSNTLKNYIWHLCSIITLSKS